MGFHLGRSIAGNVLIEALFAGVVISATAAAFVAHFDNKQKNVMTEKVRLGFLGAETNLRQSLLDDRAWTLTVKAAENAASFNCAGCTGTKCMPNVEYSFTALDGTGAPVDAGVSDYGQACASASGKCLFTANVTWKPICPVGVACVPTQAEISVDWARTGTTSNGLRLVRIPGRQSIIKNFPPVPVNAFGAVVLKNQNVKNSDCECGTQAVNDDFKIDLPIPGEFLSVQLCQPKGYSPPGQAAYRLTFCGERGNMAPCNLDCDSGYILIQTIPYDVPAYNGNPGYPAKFGVCENPSKASGTPFIISISKNDVCPGLSSEQSSTVLDMGDEIVLLRLCTTPR